MLEGLFLAIVDCVARDSKIDLYEMSSDNAVEELKQHVSELLATPTSVPKQFFAFWGSPITFDLLRKKMYIKGSEVSFSSETDTRDSDIIVCTVPRTVPSSKKTKKMKE